MFFDGVKLVTKKETLLKAPPPFIDTGWRPPQYFPNLDGASAIALDCECYDPGINQWGPGWSRGEGWIVGFSLAAIDARGNRGKWYFPLRHQLDGQYNLDPKQAFAWLREQMVKRVPKVGQNLIYDIGWLTTEKVNVVGPYYDTSFAEALIDEEAEVNLDALAHKYLGIGKTTDALYDWLALCYGGKPGQAQRANIYRCSPRLVGPYAEDDADQPLRILEKQWPIMAEEGTLSVFNMECASIPMLVRMRNDGMAIDLAMAEKLNTEFKGDIKELYTKLVHMTGRNIESVTAVAQIAPALEAAGIVIPKTPNGAPSVRKEWLKEQAHPLADLINSIRELEKFCGTFIEGYLLEGAKPDGPGRGRIHCQFHPLKGDSNGAKTGRFASSDPNLQNIPSRSKAGKRIRKAFIPDDGHLCIEGNDYSQIEYRMLAHFATSSSKNYAQYKSEMEAADALRASYSNNPKMDYHDTVFAMIAPLMKWEYPDPDRERYDRRRKPTKNVNFGLLYGQSQHALAYKAGMSKEQAKIFFEAYHKGAPYVKATMAAIAQEVQDYGFVTTILGRRCRFNLWEPANERGMPALPRWAAIQEYGSNIKRAGDYRGTNYKLQGSGTGDIIKASMVRAYQEGLFDHIGYPKLQVHDELVFSVINDSAPMNEAYDYLHHVMQTTTPCRVPISIDSARGPNWGET